VTAEPDELAGLRDAYPGYRFRRKEIRGVPCYLAEAKTEASGAIAAGAATEAGAAIAASGATGVGGATATGASAAAEAPLAAARSPAILAAMLAAAMGRPLRLRPEAVAAAYRHQLMTVTQCARLFGVSRTTIVKFLIAQGIAVRRPGDGVDEAAVIIAYRDQRLSLHECAGRFGISQRRRARPARRGPATRGQARAASRMNATHSALGVSQSGASRDPPSVSPPRPAAMLASTIVRQFGRPGETVDLFRCLVRWYGGPVWAMRSR
jgi:hypothetical protein